MRRTLLAAAGFVSGFTLVFVALGALAGTVGGFLRSHQAAVNIVSGLVVIFFGLSYLGVFKTTLFRGGSMSVNASATGFFRAMLFGMERGRGKAAGLFPGIPGAGRGGGPAPPGGG